MNAGTVTNCSFVNTYKGVYINASGTTNLTNCVFWGSATTPASPGFVNTGGTTSNITLNNCAYISINGTGYTNNNPILLPTTNNSGTNAPNFVDPTNNNWTLLPNSSLLNMGTATGAPATDLVGVSRPQPTTGGACDIGAYELPYYNTTVTFNANGTINSYTSGAVDAQPKGTQMAYTITPNAGFKITSALYNGTDITGSLVANVYTAPALTANSTLVVQFDLGTGLQKTESGIQCFSGSQSIELRGATPGNEVIVYSVTGEKIKSEMIHSANTSIAIPRGLYIVRISNQVTKIVVN